jgi:hypothetical protein
MAQESSGAVGPYETAQLNKILAQQAAAGSPSAVAVEAMPYNLTRGVVTYLVIGPIDIFHSEIESAI